MGSGKIHRETVLPSERRRRSDMPLGDIITELISTTGRGLQLALRLSQQSHDDLFCGCYVVALERKRQQYSEAAVAHEKLFFVLRATAALRLLLV